MTKFHNRTRVAPSIPKKLWQEGKPYLIPVYYLMLTSTLAREGIRNSGSYKFADHIYESKPKGRVVIGYLLDAILLSLKSAKSFKSRYLFAKKEIQKYIQSHENSDIDVLAVPSGHARELFEVAEENRGNSRIKMYGLDLDTQVVSEMNLKAQENQYNITFIHGDALDAKSYDKLYDIIVSIGLAEFINDEHLRQFYRMCYDHLKPGGIFVTSGMIPHKFSDYLMRNLAELHTNYRSEEHLKNLARECGFTNYKTYQDANKIQTMLIVKKI